MNEELSISVVKADSLKYVWVNVNITIFTLKFIDVTDM
jgi:hypothetical protein